MLTKEIVKKEVVNELDLFSLVKDKELLSRAMSNFDLVKLKKMQLDKRILAILKLFKEKNLLVDFCKVQGEEFNEACGQYVNALAMVLLKVDPMTELFELRGYEIKYTEFRQGMIVKEMNDKWKSVGFIPHVVLGIKLGRTEYMLDPKYFDFKGNSDIAPKFHTGLTSSMTVKYPRNPKKSGVFLPYKKVAGTKFDFSKFPVLVKDKSGKVVAYRMCLRSRLSF